MLAQSLRLLSIYKVTSTSSPALTFLVISLYGRNKSFSSPQSKNAPILPTSNTGSTASCPNTSFGSLVVAIRRSLESRYKKISTLSPTRSPSGTCFAGKSTLVSSSGFSARYIPNSTFFTAVSSCFSPRFIFSCFLSFIFYDGIWLLLFVCQ